MKSFRDRSNETELSKLSKLSKYIWQLKDESKHLQHTLRNTCVSCALKMWHKALRSIPNRKIYHCTCRPGLYTKQKN